MRIWLTAAAIAGFAASNCARAEIPQGLVGSTIPPYPSGLQEIGGTCIGGPGEAPCAVSMGILADAERKPVLIYAGKEAGLTGDIARWFVTDAVDYPVITGHEALQFDCHLKDSAESIVWAVTGTSANSDFTARRWAIRFDRPTGKLVRVLPSAVACVAGEAD